MILVDVEKGGGRLFVPSLFIFYFYFYLYAILEFAQIILIYIVKHTVLFPVLYNLKQMPLSIARKIVKSLGLVDM